MIAVDTRRLDVITNGLLQVQFVTKRSRLLAPLSRNERSTATHSMAMRTSISRHHRNLATCSASCLRL